MSLSLSGGSSSDKGGGAAEKRKREATNVSGNSNKTSNSNNHNNRNNNPTKQQQQQQPVGNPKTTLASLLGYMEGYEVIVELKTGRRHRGRLTSADDNMNLILEEDENEHEHDDKKGQAKPQTDAPKIQILRNIRGSSVRYVHFPDNADLTALVRSGRERERNAARRYQKTKRKSGG